MKNYYIIESNEHNIDISEVHNKFWFTNPIKKEGCKHRTMAKVTHTFNWKNEKSCSYSESCSMKVYTYGSKLPIVINGWTFYPDDIKGRYALSRCFYGMEMWFTCCSPSGEKIRWYRTFYAASEKEFSKNYFLEIHRISKYKSIKEAQDHTCNDSTIKVYS